MKDDMMLGDTPKAKKRRNRLKAVQARGRLWKHSTLADIDGLVSLQDLAGLCAFTLVRNPWDRAVSYYHWLQTQTFDHAAVTLAKSRDFPAFVTHPVIQASFRDAPASAYMRRADGVEQCAAYIRLEHFESDVQPVVDHLGFDLVLPKANSSDRDSDYRLYYTDTARAAVQDACAEDIDRFGYDFDQGYLG